MFELIAKVMNFIFSTFSVWAGTPNLKKTSKNSRNGKIKKDKKRKEFKIAKVKPSPRWGVDEFYRFTGGTTLEIAGFGSVTLPVVGTVGGRLTGGETFC